MRFACARPRVRTPAPPLSFYFSCNVDKMALALAYREKPRAIDSEKEIFSDGACVLSSKWYYIKVDSVINFRQKSCISCRNRNYLGSGVGCATALKHCAFHLFWLNLRTGLRWLSTGRWAFAAALNTSARSILRPWGSLCTRETERLGLPLPWPALWVRQWANTSWRSRTVAALWGSECAANAVCFPS